MPSPRPTRRSFLKGATASAAALASSGSLSALAASGPVHQGTGKLKVGVVGIGGRGAGATANALLAHPENVLHAVGDAFPDRLENGLGGILEGLTALGRQEQIDVPAERRFVGIDAIDKVLATGVDAIVLATPPAFRPAQIEKAVASGVHIFAEKPIAVDAPGVRRVHEACKVAAQKGLTVVSGLVYRYHEGRRQLIERLHAGGVGEILAIQGDYLTNELWFWEREPQWTDLQWQLRNWLYHPWLSGDLIAEQHIHTLDMMAWIKRDVYPTSAVSLGGRQSRIDPKFGTVFDHMATTYEWADGTRGYSSCRQQNNCWRNVNELVIGTEGRANVFQHTIQGAHDWHFDGKVPESYQRELTDMFAAIRGGERIDNSEYMCNSTLMAVMGRMAAYTGQRITWEQAWNSTEVLMPEPLAWDGEARVGEVARPGITRFA
ncbi:MAG: Gfo/Idh/MocA family oxidoreductase [Planctomycetes bacterium]|nr:Gfo/Idh/MocA family oxidoreductase [Planctomycetota bacterium]